MVYDILVRSGYTVLPDSEGIVDVAIVGERIAAVGNLGEAEARKVVDARGKLVLPGLVDPHVHFCDRAPTLGMAAVDDFYSASVGAAFGGTTTVLDFAYPHSASAAETILARCRAITDRSQGIPLVDYGFHAVMEEDSPTALASLAELPEIGVTSIKAFMSRGRMAESDGLRAVMQHAAAANLMVMVHAENADLLRHLQAELAQQGRVGVADFVASAPPVVEAVAVAHALALAHETKAALYIVHVSSAAAVSLIRQAQAEGVRVYAETLPQYLLLDESCYTQPDGARYICSPPLRQTHDQAALWQAIADGVITSIGTDHCGFSLAQRTPIRDDFRLVPGGLVGIETRSALLYTYGVQQGRFSLRTFVDLLAANPARLFGLYPRKGALAVGSDADLCIMDPDLRWILRADDLHVAWGWTPFEGFPLVGKPMMTIRRGEILTCDDQLSAGPRPGQFLSRAAATLE